MRILIFSNMDSAKPFGQFTRPFFLGRELAAQGHTIAQVGVATDAVDYGPSWSSGQQQPRAMASVLRMAARQFVPDIVYAHQNLPSALAATVGSAAPVAADFHSLPSLEWLVLLRYGQLRGRARAASAFAKAEAAERYVARRADVLVAAGSEVAAALQRRHHSVRPVLIPNGVEPGMLSRPAQERSPFPAGLSRRNALAILPVNAMPQNRLALELLERVASELVTHDVSIHVVGTSAGPSSSPNIRYHGFVDELDSWIDHADVCLLPYPQRARLFGGAKNKLLEYLARGTRIVSTRDGLWGLSSAAMWPGVFVADDDPRLFGEMILRSLSDGAPRLDSARSELTARYRWDVLARDLADALASACCRGAGRHSTQVP